MIEWKDLSETEQMAWINSGEPNGCGAKGGWFRPPYSIMFEACCNIHDYGYKYGVTRKDRKKADLGLLKYMKADVKRLELYRRPWFYLVSYTYYIGLRMFGGRAFNK